MKTSQNGIDLIKSFEGCILTAYKCLPSEQYYTIGYGHYGPDVKIGMRISKEYAEELLKKDLERFEANVNRYDRIYDWKQNEFDALVSFAYNIGSIDQLTANGTRSKKIIAEKMLLYVNSGGKKIQGLVNRRIKENQLFCGDAEPIMQPKREIAKPTLRRGMKKSKQVRILQQNLNDAINAGLDIDGDFGPLTKQAVIDLQTREYGKTYFAKIDGIYGPCSESCLKEVLK